MLGVGACFWAGARPASPCWRHSAARAQLVRRQPRRHAGARPPDGAPALRLLRRPRARRDRLRVALIAGLCSAATCRWRSAWRFSRAYYLLVIEVALCGARARRTFRMSFWQIGPTELRILLAARHARAAVGRRRHARSDRSWLLFDVGGLCGIAGLVADVRRGGRSGTAALYREEPLRGRGRNMIARCPFWRRSTTFFSARRSARRRNRSASTSSSRATPEEILAQARSTRSRRS